jgi:hypothetical protein
MFLEYSYIFTVCVKVSSVARGLWQCLTSLLLFLARQVSIRQLLHRSRCPAFGARIGGEARALVSSHQRVLSFVSVRSTAPFRKLKVTKSIHEVEMKRTALLRTSWQRKTCRGRLMIRLGHCEIVRIQNSGGQMKRGFTAEMLMCFRGIEDFVLEGEMWLAVSRSSFYLRTRLVVG